MARACAIPAQAAGHTSYDMVSTSPNEQAVFLILRLIIGWRFAAIEGLKALKQPCKVLLVTDSTYLLNGINIYRHAWRENGWVIRRKNNKPVPNADLWKVLDELLEQHTVECKWVRGHSGSPDNERCDKLATSYAAGMAIT